MKRYALLALTLSFPLVHLASAADDGRQKQKQVARDAATVNRMAARASGNSPRQFARPQVRQFQQNQSFARNNINVQPQTRARIYNPVNRAPRMIAQTPTIQTPAVVAQPRVALNQNNSGNRNWNRGNANWRLNNNNNGSGNWQNNNRGSGNWQGNNNGSGNWQGNNNGNWSDRSDNWRRRHGHWNRHHHNRSWWRNNYTRFALFGGGYYYWNSGYWYPAYGYDPYFSTYTYDAPIYAYNDQDPGQVISNVQVELQRRGYNPGAVDGTYGPMTRSALIRFQGDNGLPVTGEIDEDTLNSLGLQ